MGANFPGAGNDIPCGGGIVTVEKITYPVVKELPHELDPNRRPHVEKALRLKMGEWLKIGPERISVELKKTVSEDNPFETFRAKVTEVLIDGQDLNKRQEAIVSLVLEDSFFPIKEQ